jgi:large subunit ribosomal protein L18
MDAKTKQSMKRRRHRRVRNSIVGTAERPRLTVFRSAKHIYAQVIDDAQGITLASASSLKLGDVKPADSKDKDKDKVGRKIAIAREVGKRLAEAAAKQGVQKVQFDRGGFKYHGRVAGVAAGAREGGLEF